MHIFVISILIYVTKADDSDSKYINLLPAKQKEEFLDNIARRILEEVAAKGDTPEESKEIPDEQLNEHDALVHRIMKEESENLRRNANDSNVSNTNIGRELNEKAIYVDLTLRATNRSKRESDRRVFTGYSVDNDNGTENTSKESEVDIQVKNFRKSGPKLNETVALDETIVKKLIDEASNHEKNSTQSKFSKREATEQVDENQQNTQTTAPQNIEYTKTETSIQTEVSTDVTNDQQDKDSTTPSSSIDFTTGETFKASALLDDIKKTYENVNYDNSSTTQESSTTTLSSSIDFTTTETFTASVLLDDIKKTYENVNYDNSSTTQESSTLADVVPSVEQKPVNSTNKAIESDPKRSSNEESNNNKTNILKDSNIINIEIATIPVISNVLNVTAYNNTATETSQTEVNINVTEEITTNKDDLNSITTEEPEKSIKEFNEFTTEEIAVLTHSTVEKDHNISKKKESKSETKNRLEKEIVTLKKEGKKKKLSKDSKVFVDDVIKALRLKLLENDEVKKPTNYNFDKRLKYILMKPREPRVHEVFEVPPGTSPFVKQKPKKQKHDKILKHQNPKKSNNRQPKKTKMKKTNEQPHHVPIYNYIPNNAFYNPRNVLGPNPEDEDDDDEKYFYAMKKDEGPKFPSFMPKSAQKYSQKKTETENQPFHVPIYYYNPKNAYYNPKNYYGPNFHNSNEIKDQNKEEYDDSDYDFDKSDEITKERDHMEWQYYNDPHVRIKDTPNKKKNGFEVNLPKSVLDFIKKDTNIDLKSYINKNYNGDKNVDNIDQTERPSLRCGCIFKTKCTKCNYEPISKEEEETLKEEEEVIARPVTDTMSRIRNLLLEAKHFMLVHHTNTSKYNELFKESDSEEDKYPKRKTHRSSLPIFFKDLYNRNSQKTQNFAFDYYNREDDENQSTEANDNPIKLTYYKRPNRIKKPNTFVNQKTLRDFLKKYKKPDKELERNTKSLRQFLDMYKRNSRSKTEKPALRYAKGDKAIEYDLVKEITDMVDEPEIMKLYLQLEKLEQAELKNKSQRSSGKEFDVFEEVLGDMVAGDHRGLGKYDWLGTAVDVRSAMKKLVDMTESIKQEEDIHPSDLELLKYLVFLHKHSKKELEQSGKKSLRGLVTHPNKRPHSKEPDKNHRWHVRESTPIPKGDLSDFQLFLEDLQNALYDLHTAIKYISIVTKYQNQRWFENLKQIHLDSERKSLLGLLLHLCTTRLLGMVEESAKNGLEDDFVEYLKTHEKEGNDVREEFVFVLKLLEEIKRVK